MIYLADSGSTKCDAILMEKDGTEILRYRSVGYNPYMHPLERMQEGIKQIPEVKQYGAQVKEVYYYGAGCSTPQLKAKMAQALEAGFPNAKIIVDHDLMASSYATYTGEPAVSCILGTGSNCSYFDGENIELGNSGYGFILGDEGSASYIGKKVLAGYVYKLMPDEAYADFKQEYGFTKNDILSNLYEKPNPNVFLGNLAPFAKKYIHLDFFYNAVKQGFVEFLSTQVKPFEKSSEVPIHFVGSIAFHFEDVLKDALKELNLQMGQIVRRPLDGLKNYHLKYIFS